MRLNKLESLDLDANNFNRSIIQSLRLLTSLKSLNLSHNAMEGSLPTKGMHSPNILFINYVIYSIRVLFLFLFFVELSVFEDLEILDLSNNRLDGSETVQGRDIEKP